MILEKLLTTYRDKFNHLSNRKSREIFEEFPEFWVTPLFPSANSSFKPQHCITAALKLGLKG